MELAFSRSGTGEPLVLLHGVGHRRQAWREVANRLARDFDVIAVDLPGFGESPSLPGSGEVTTAQLIDVLLGQFDAWGIHDAHLAGNSLGGFLSLELARRGRARSVTAFSPAGFTGRTGFVPAQFTLRRLWLAAKLAPGPLARVALRSKFLRRRTFGALFAHAERYPASAAIGDTLALKRTDSFARTLPLATRHQFTGHVDVPVTIAWGTKDKVFRHGLSKIAAKRLPDALHVTLADAGHVPMADLPDRVARLIAETARRTTD